MILSLAALLLLLLADPAAAHGTLPGGNGFQAGALHPLVAIEHLLALLVTGLAVGRADGRGVVATGLLALFAGLALGLMRETIPAPGPAMILLVALVLGLLLLRGGRLPIGVIAPPVLLLGWAIGADTDIPAGSAMAGAGLFVAAGLIALNLAALSQWAGARWPIVPRVAGSWFFAIALMVLALQVGSGTGLVAALP